MSEVYGGYRWEQQTKAHLQDPKFLERYGFKVYSQNDEDGILQEIFERIGTQTKKFVEFGVQDGLECNSHYLLHKGWTGLWLEGSETFYHQIQEKFSSVIANGALKTDNVFITRENIDSILDANGIHGEIDLLCIDLDGNDYHVWAEISQIAPRVVCIEYNGKFPPDYEWIMPYYNGHVWQGNDYFGASLKALEKLGAQKGYQLVGTNITGVNAFFVRSDIAGGKFPLPATAENLYNAPQYQTRHITGHPSEFCLMSSEEETRNRNKANAGCREHDAGFEAKMIRVDARQDADTLFDMLVETASKTDCIMIENGRNDDRTKLVIFCFLNRYKMFLEYVHMKVSDMGTEKRNLSPGGGDISNQGRIYIKLRSTINRQGKAGYSELVNAYTESYYMTDCGGYDDFQNSQGMELTPRLRDICSLVCPSRGERILDIGCGRGELTCALAMAGAQAEGIDYSNDAITIAKRSFMGKCKTLRYTCADIFKIDNLDSFDKIIMADVVEHIEQDILEKIFYKIALALNKNGCLIIHTAPNRDYYERTYPQLREQAVRLGCWKPRNPRSYYEQLMHINEQTPDGLRAALEKYFQYVRVWTGSVREADVEKTTDKSCMDMDIFAIACQENGLIDRQISNAVKRPSWNDCGVSIEAEDVVIPPGEREKTVNVVLTNTGMEVLSSQRIYPIHLSYHLLDPDENMLLFDGERALIQSEIRPGMTQEMQLRLVIPSNLACLERCVCRITLVAEGCFWFDQEGANKKDILISFRQKD